VGKPKQPHWRRIKGVLYKAGRGLKKEISKDTHTFKKDFKQLKKWSHSSEGKEVEGTIGAVVLGGLFESIKTGYFIPNYWDGISRSRSHDYKGYNPTPLHGNTFLQGYTSNRQYGTNADIIFFKEPFRKANAMIITKDNLSFVPSASDFFHWDGTPPTDPRIESYTLKGNHTLKPLQNSQYIHKIFQEKVGEDDKTIIVLTNSLQIEMVGKLFVRFIEYRKDNNYGKKE